MLKNRSRGFTLIELLVVIAIIGILSAVVLASLSTARQKGQDAAIQSDLATIQTQAEIYYGSNGNTYGAPLAWAYTTPAACSTGMFTDPNITKALAGAYTASGSTSGYVGCTIGAGTYVVAVKQVASTTGAYWCIDNTGVAKAESGSVPTSAITNCP